MRQLLSRLLQSLKHNPARRPRPALGYVLSRKPLLEALEDRLAPAATTAVLPALLDGTESGTVTGNVLSYAYVSNPTSLVVTIDGVPQPLGVPLSTDWGALLTVSPSGDFSYDPNGAFAYLQDGQAQPDTFGYVIANDAGDTATGSVIITVHGSNDPPQPNNDSNVTTVGVPVSFNVLTNDVDPDDDPASLVVSAVNSVPGNVGVPVTGAYGSLSLSSDGNYVYTPASANAALRALGEGQSLDDTFNYTASDPHGGSATASLTITVFGVNDPPTPVADLVTTTPSTPVTFSVLTNDSDPDGDALSVSSHTNPAHGSLTDNGGGSFTYAPVSGFTGPDTFSYTVSDGHGGTASASVNILVSAVNTPPVAVNDSFVTNEDTTLTGNVLANDTDPGHLPLTAILASAPTHGTLTLNSHGSFTYAPALNYNGTDSFTYKASDGTATSNVATVHITINAVNDPPVAVNDAVVTGENATVTFSVLTNDRDPDGDALSVTSFTNPSHGSLTRTGGNFTYTPASGYFGPDSFHYTISDGHGGTATASVNITVTPGAVSLQNGVLRIDGTDDRDVIHVTRHGNTIRVDVRFGIQTAETDNDDDDDDRWANSTLHQHFTFPASSVTSIVILARGGNDHVQVGTSITVPAYIDGGSGNDWLRGGSGNDTIIDLSGNNRIGTGDGNDVVTAGNGNDFIWTGKGDDVINAGDGNNEIHAGDGNDVVTAGNGNDFIWTGKGDDVINAGDGNNEIHAGDGNDVVTAGCGNDSIWTGKGNDVINAGDGNNEIHAGDGNNTITAGSGNDAIWSGKGNDVINAGDGNNTVSAGAGDDVIVTGSGRDVIDGGAGNDVIVGAGNDVVQGGDGNDILIGGDGNDTLVGGDGNDIIIGGSGADVLVGSGADDVLIAGYTSYDANTPANNVALQALLKEWTSNASYAVRVSHLQTGTNVAGGYRLDGNDGATQTVFNDNDVDTITGSQGSDWYLANQKAGNGGVLDVVTDKAASEIYSDTDF